jgi:N-terminal region of Chorein or VPS13
MRNISGILLADCLAAEPTGDQSTLTCNIANRLYLSVLAITPDSYLSMKAWQALSSGWTAFAIPSNIQKRLYKFLLRKSIGRFLAQELDFENFDVELVNGCIELRDLDLNLEVSYVLSSYLPVLPILKGFIQYITGT